MSTERRALAKNTVIQVIGKIIGTILGLLTFWLLIHSLDDAGYGALTKAQTYASVFAILVDFGLTLTTAQMISEPGANEKRILGTIFSLRAVSAFLFLSIAPISALFLPTTGEERIAILCFAGAFFFSSLAQVFVGVFQKRLMLAQATFAETANRTVAFLGVLAVWYWNLGLGAASFAFVIGGFIQVILMLRGVSTHVPVTFIFDSKIAKNIIKKSWPIGVSIFFNLLYLKGDVLFMWLFGRSDVEIGYYGGAYKVIDVVTTIPITLMGLLLPLLVSAWASKNTVLFYKRMQDGLDVLAMLGLPFAFGSIFCGVAVMTLIKSSLSPAGQVLAILGPTATMVFFGSLFSYTVVAINKQRLMTWAYAFVATLTIIGYAIFIPNYGMWAAAGMSLFAETLIGTIAAIVVLRATKWKPHLGITGKAFLASIGMSGILFFVRDTPAWIMVPLGTATYVAFLAALGGPSPKSLLRIFQPSTNVLD
ncbi:MAG: oligosaccharide flippase family protein [Patescibacteria group bacterium]|jgi:O-antigen/teichoic acid export membrane protein